MASRFDRKNTFCPMMLAFKPSQFFTQLLDGKNMDPGTIQRDQFGSVAAAEPHSVSGESYGFFSNKLRAPFGCKLYYST